VTADRERLCVTGPVTTFLICDIAALAASVHFVSPIRSDLCLIGTFAYPVVPPNYAA
jgi:hypothetical protein